MCEESEFHLLILHARLGLEKSLLSANISFAMLRSLFVRTTWPGKQVSRVHSIVLGLIWFQSLLQLGVWPLRKECPSVSVARGALSERPLLPWFKNVLQLGVARPKVQK